MSVMDKLGFSFQVMILGMLTVFVGLILLIAIISIISRIIESASGRPRTVKSVAVPEEIVSDPSDEIEVVLEDDPQLIAVIAAALAAYQEAGKKLVVRSVRRVGSRSAWAEAGRREQLF